MTSSLSESLGGGSPLDWAHDWLVIAGFPTTGENLRTVVAWELAESGGGGGMWNPLNTTQPWPNSTDANSAHVKNYATRNDGLGANAHVIHNGLYGPVVNAFSRGDNAYVTVGAIVTSPWGTRRINLGGPVPNPPPPPPPPPPPEEPMLYAAPVQKQLNKFTGVKIDLPGRKIIVLGGAGVTPAPTINNPNAWIGSYSVPGDQFSFVVVTADGDTYKFRLEG